MDLNPAFPRGLHPSAKMARMFFTSFNYHDTRRVLVGYPPMVSGNDGRIFMLGKALSRHTKETSAGFYETNE
jgi:hypothetical protein